MRATAPSPRDYARADSVAGARLAEAPTQVRWLRTAGGDSIPWRLFVPARRARATTSATTRETAPPPLLIALHGAGATEHTFAIAYGAGELLRVAEARKAILDIAKTDKFDLIVEQAVYFNPRIDITDRVMKALGDK